MSVTAQLRAALSFSQTRTAVLGAAPSWSAAFDQIVSLVNGTGAGQFDLGYAAERTVASAANDDIDLAGVLTDAYGAAVTIAELVAIMIVNKQRDGTANTTDLTPGGGSNFVPGFSAALPPISPGGIFMMVAPGAAGLATVTASTGDILRVANSSGAQNKFQIAILGRSA
ncbi:hypothetical protein [Methylosinus sporium]|uniref:Uncharacterized protein n=1 Tax=Methylosinus sporium TaxID=428 RepID=A0A2U1SSR9_METSR|nr:hypothetical protein [Methylosinus sporium]PWB94661.1 hypothetical protein C5689_06250 [Methylosinus sporium]